MLGASILSVLLATCSRQSNHEQSHLDAQFHIWCDSVGIATPLARLETTPRSVAGRGVFASQNIEKGDVVMSIPENVVFNEYNAAVAFPKLASTLWKQKVRYKNVEDGNRRWWHRFSIPRRQLARRDFEFTDSSDLWQATLTAFSLACIKTNHPWNGWISQWQRSDPMQRLFEKGVTWRDEADVLACVDELSKMLPDVSKAKLRVAVEVRLGRFEELRAVFKLDDVGASSMYGVMTSRAIELADGVLGVLPGFDMINHSNEPNIAMEYTTEEKFQLWALRDIPAGEELFVCYKDIVKTSSSGWDENDAVWMLVQWGIPLPRPCLTGAPQIQEATSINNQQRFQLR
jgi:SET domain